MVLVCFVTLERAQVPLSQCCHLGALAPDHFRRINESYHVVAHSILLTSTKPQSTVHSALAMVTETFGRSPDAANAFPRWCFWALRKSCTSFNFAWDLSIYSLEEFRYPLSIRIKHPWLLSASASAVNLGSLSGSSIFFLIPFLFR